MLRSLFSAVSGLRAHQTMMDVIGNNIANVNTPGYKSSQTVFEDTLSQIVRASGMPQATSGGTNPAQVGLGVRVGGISTNFAQGATQMTGRATDVALQGDGFFVVKMDNQTFYSRAGAFSFDANGNLVNPDGGLVQGWSATNGAVNTNGPLSAIKLPIGQSAPPTQTTKINVGGNLKADAPTYDSTKPDPTSQSVSTVDIYDSQGKKVTATMTYTKTGDNTWQLDVTVPDPSDPAKSVPVGSTPLSWDPATNSFKPAVPSITLSKTSLAPAGSFNSDITVNLGTATNPLTQYASADTASVLNQDGAAMGSLASFTLAPDGQIVGVFTNGVKQTLGQVAVANFDNPGGLEKAGGSLYSGTSNSGIAQVGTAGNGGRGTMQSGALEMSNVDLAQEFTNLIVAQRGFEANSKVVSTSDEILQSLVNMKR